MKRLAVSIAIASLTLSPLTARCEETPAKPAATEHPAQPAPKVTDTSNAAPAKPAAVEAPAGTAAKETDAAKPAHGKGPADVTGKGESKMMKMMSGMGGGEELKSPITGKVVEVLTGGGYTYLSLEKDGQKTWVAVPGSDAKVGEEVTVNGGQEMIDFSSKSLNRKFEKIIFSEGATVQRPAGKDAPQEMVPISGRVVETMNGGGYTYILLKKKGTEEKIWIAAPQMQAVVGSEMTFAPGMPMTGFESKALKRTFDTILFTSGPVKQAGPPEQKAMGKSKGSKGAVPASGAKISVEKAEGENAYRVADIYRLKGKLDKKKVVVRGKVVKVSQNIMGKNWIHIQDGSGDAKKGTNNLVVTSQALPADGDVVTITGTLYKDKDFGSGYKYTVIVEKAEVAIQ
jgi:biotin carboxyl carrier protein